MVRERHCRRGSGNLVMSRPVSPPHPCFPPAFAQLVPRRLAPRLVAPKLVAIGLLMLCAGCAGSGSQTRWDGRRGYDGTGDYGYDLAASRAEARSYRARAARSYPVPGTPDDPWGPYVREAASRYQVPERWIREVMRQESGGRQFDGRGGLVTSSAGAMGLMQVMPATYHMLRRRYRLGDDPFDPHDNIMAGTAYIREMYERFGSPGFLAAYNAGPDRLDAYLSGASGLPDETIGYLSSIAPRLGNPESMTGPLAVYAGGTAMASASRSYGGSAADRAYMGGGAVASADRAYMGGGAVASADRAYMGGGAVASADRAYMGGGAVASADRAYMGGGAVASADRAYMGGGQVASADQAYMGGGAVGGDVAANDPSLRAFDGGGLVTPNAPTGVLTRTGWVGAAQSAQVAPTTAAPSRAPAEQAAPAAQPTYAAAYAAPAARAGSTAYAPSLAPPPAYAAASAPAAYVPPSQPAYAPPSQPAYASPSQPAYASVDRRAALQAPAAVAVPVVAEALPSPAPITRAVATAPITAMPRNSPFGSAQPVGVWSIQVGAFPSPATSDAALSAARSRAASLLAGAQQSVTPVQRSGTLFRARFVGLSAEQASAACGRLSGAGMPCFTVPPGS